MKKVKGGPQIQQGQKLAFPVLCCFCSPSIHDRNTCLGFSHCMTFCKSTALKMSRIKTFKADKIQTKKAFGAILTLTTLAGKQ